MPPQKGTPVITKIKEEQLQGPRTRRGLYLDVEKALGLPVVSFFTSMRYRVLIDDGDADMLEGILQKTDVSHGFALLISSPGGMALAAERIINVCRSYSGIGSYEAIVPGKAKSAATMICLGATKIIMGKTSELGPVDPQLLIGNDGIPYSVYNIVQSYKKLFADAVATKGNQEPFLQQLSNYDPRDIAEFEKTIALSDDISTRALKSGMMSASSEDQIKKNIAILLTPETVKSHGRPVLAPEALSCGLNIDLRQTTDPLWIKVYELCLRLNNYVSTNKVAKCIETKDLSYRTSTD